MCNQLKIFIVAKGKKKAQKKKTTKPRVFTEAQRDVRRATSLNWYYYNMENTPGFKEAQREKSAVCMLLHSLQYLYQ